MLALVLATAGCVTAGVTAFGPAQPPLPEGCPVEMFPSGPPPYPHQDVASARVTCFTPPGRVACLENLKTLACRAGADTVHALAETVTADGVTHIAAVLARRQHGATETVMAAARPRTVR